MSFTHPHTIEIEINSNCNLACSYCPNSVAERIEQGNMDPEIFQRIISQLKERNYKGTIAFDFYNEPMLAKHFNDFIKVTRKNLPDSPIELYSNGTQINSEDRANELIALGITKVVITKHEDIKKLPIEGFIDKLDSRFILRDHTDLTLTNRGGILENVGDNITGNLPCQIPSLMMTVTVKGNVLPCFEDFKQEKGMGNINKSHILDIWNSKEYQDFRSSLLKGEREKHSICKNCNRVSQKMRPENNKHFFGEEEIGAFRRVVEKGNLFRYQNSKSECALFEEEFCHKTGAPFALLVTSGTNALILALEAEGIGHGDEVIIPSHTFVATANAVTNVGAIPVIANINDELCLSSDDVVSKITPKTKAIIPVHMDGLLCDLEALEKIAKDHNLIIIEDAAQCLGGKYKNKYAGTIGDYGCFSLNMDKVLTAGEGGIIVTKTREQYERLCLLSDGAFSYSPHHQEFFQEEVPSLGHSMRVSEFTGAIMREQLKKWDLILSEHKLRKIILEEPVKKHTKVKLIKGHDKDGETGVSLHLRFEGPDVAMVAGKKLRDHSVPAIPITLRPAHVSWKWSELLEKKTGRKYPKTEVIQSVEIIMSTLRIPININWSIEETKIFADRIKLVLEELKL